MAVGTAARFVPSGISLAAAAAARPTTSAQRAPVRTVNEALEEVAGPVLVFEALASALSLEAVLAVAAAVVVSGVDGAPLIGAAVQAWEVHPAAKISRVSSTICLVREYRASTLPPALCNDTVSD